MYNKSRTCEICIETHFLQKNNAAGYKVNFNLRLFKKHFSLSKMFDGKSYIYSVLSFKLCAEKIFQLFKAYANRGQLFSPCIRHACVVYMFTCLCSV